MKKKLLAILVLVMLVSGTSIFAFGIGVQGGYTAPTNGGAAITFKVDSVPLVFAVNAAFGDTFSIGGTADYWILNNKLAGPVNYYVGAGVGAMIAIGNNGGFALTARVPVGINMFFAKGVIEPYLQLVPGVGFNFSGGNLINFAFDANIGIRFWF